MSGFGYHGGFACERSGGKIHFELRTRYGATAIISKRIDLGTLFVSFLRILKTADNFD